MKDTKAYERTLAPRAWLALMRERHGANIPFRWSENVDDLISRIPTEQRDAAIDVWKSRVGKSIAEIHDEQFQVYLDRLLPIVTDSQKELLSETYFGLYPTGKFNGYAGRTPRGDRIVMLHAGLPHSLAIWAHFFVRQMEEGGGIETFEANLHLHVDVLEYFSSVWTGSVPARTPDIYPKTADGWSLSEELTQAAICFVIGHEMGHVHLNHKGYTSNREENHEKEFAADLYGLKLCIRNMMLHSPRFNDNYHTMLMLFGPFLALGVIALLGSKDSETHPGVIRRRASLVQGFPAALKAELGTAFDALAEHSPDFINIIAENSLGLMMIGEMLSDELRRFLIVSQPAGYAWFNETLFET